MLRTNQSADSFTHVMLGNIAATRLVFIRSQEAREQVLKSQDFACVSSSPDSQSCFFCVCDGVGSSHRGDFAARYLGERLIAWLHEHPPLITQDRLDQSMPAALYERMGAWAREGQDTLQHVPRPEQHPLIREVVDELLATYGSETVFFAGRIDRIFPRPLTADLPIFCLSYYWMGNVNAWLLHANGEILRLNQSPDDANRWSSARGVRGALGNGLLPLLITDRLVVHSDGLDRLGPQIANLDDRTLWRAVSALLTLPTSDDMTALDLRFQR